MSTLGVPVVAVLVLIGVVAWAFEELWPAKDPWAERTKRRVGRDSSHCTRT